MPQLRLQAGALTVGHRTVERAFLCGDGRVLGFLDGDRGVSVLLVDELRVLTPEGVGIAVAEDRVRAAYPGVVEGPAGLRATVSGFPDREYTFAFDHRRVAEMSFRLRDQNCVG